MKRIIAIALCSVMLFSSSICVCAADPSTGGSASVVKEDIEEIKKQNEELRKQIEALTELVKAKQTVVVEKKSGGGGGGGGRSSAPPATSSGNYVNFGGTVTYQGGKIEINGGKSNATFTITAPSSAVVSSAATLAGKVGGSLVSCITTSSPGVGFKTAKVNFYVAGVQNGDTIAVYQNQGGSWVQLPVTEVRLDHVVVNMTKHGDLAFVRVPAVAAITN
ncbi:MAG: hypothetical protein IJ260_09795 [Butyrivibrio sp.]|nr:hypothetical protein [Butyrivibrio sp.]MBQ8031799.1 hypothetical protein [Butyrivibrio sp.]MBR1642090.1 hypothetical protein [Butyrivibrio sp.]